MFSDADGYAANYADSELAGHDYEDPVPVGMPWNDVRLLIEAAYVAGYNQARTDIRERV